MRKFVALKIIIGVWIPLLAGITFMGFANPAPGLASQYHAFWYYYQNQKVPLQVVEGQIVVKFREDPGPLEPTMSLSTRAGSTLQGSVRKLP